MNNTRIKEDHKEKDFKIPESIVVTACTTRLNTKKKRLLSCHCIKVFRMIIGINNYYFPKQR
jgi:hypothetical protein